MIPQEREIQGLSVIPIFLLPFLSKGGDQLRELLGEGQEILFSPRGYLNLPLVQWGGLTDDLCTIFSFTHPFLPHTLPCTP